MCMTPTESERTACLSVMLQGVGAKMICTYQFGDSWEHGIVLEKRLPASQRNLGPPHR
jgi:hypothetical protein